MPSFLENLRLKNIFGIPEGGMVGDNPYQYRTPPFVPEGGGMFGKPKNPFAGIFGDGMEQSPVAAPMGSPMGGDMEVGPTTGGGMNDIASRMRQIYSPETEATDRYNQLIDSMPQRNKPGMLRKIASIAAGTLAGPEAFDMSMYGNYNNQMKDWSAKLDPAYKAATLERSSNVNERTLAMQTISAQLREDAQRAKEANDIRRASIAQQRADVYEFKAKHPNLDIDFSGPEVIAIDPLTGKRAPITDLDGKPVQTGNMSEADKLAFQRETTMKGIAARGSEARTTQEEGHEQDMDEILARGEQARTTKSTPSGSGTGKDELPTQTRVRQFNAARELANSRPDLKPFIKIGTPGSNDFAVTPPGENFFGPTGPTKEQFEEINQAIYGGALSRSSGAGGGGKQQPIRKTQRNRNTGETRTLESTDGGKTWKVVTGAAAATK